MYSAFLERTKEAISALNKHIHTSERFRTAVFDNSLICVAGTPCFDPVIASAGEVPDRVQWRIIDHCAAVTRIYAIYEQFAHEMIREHLSLLQAKLLFSDLPDSLKTAYRLGVSKILEKKDGPRYGNLDLIDLIENYNFALKGEKYTLEPRAILMQEQNLRFNELNRFMSGCGIDGVPAWIERHRKVHEFFSSSDRITATAENELTELIKYRNDAAHGSIDLGDILHVNVLTEFCDFIMALCEALTERVQLSGLNLLLPYGYASERGKVTESYKGNMIAVGEMTGTFRIGDTVYLCGENYCLERCVVSLQVDGVSHEEVVLEEPRELGLMFDKPGKKNSILLTLDSKDTVIVSPDSQAVEECGGGSL